MTERKPSNSHSNFPIDMNSHVGCPRHAGMSRASLNFASVPYCHLIFVLLPRSPLYSCTISLNTSYQRVSKRRLLKDQTSQPNVPNSLAHLQPPLPSQPQISSTMIICLSQISKRNLKRNFSHSLLEQWNVRLWLGH